VTALAFAPDGSEISASGYHEITVWSSEDGRLIRGVKDVAQSTLSLAYQPRGKLLTAASGTPRKMGEVKLFNAISGQLVRVLVTSADVMLAVTFSPDGAKLATGGSDNKIHIFEVASGKLERTIEQHSDWVTGLAFSHNGKWLASASRDKSARVCDSTTCEVEQSFLGHGDFVFSVGFTVDDKQVWSCGRDRTIQRWRPTEEKKKEGECPDLKAISWDCW
jgi:WD40 repeat protein